MDRNLGRISSNIHARLALQAEGLDINLANMAVELRAAFGAVLGGETEPN